MASPLATEKILRCTLQALQRGGFLTSGSDVAAIEATPNNATDSDISTIVGSLSYGSVPGFAGDYTSDGDLNLLYDTDSSSTAFAPEYLKIQYQTTTSSTDPLSSPRQTPSI